MKKMLAAVAAILLVALAFSTLGVSARDGRRRRVVDPVRRRGLWRRQ